MEIVAAVVTIRRIVRYNILCKGGFKRMNYKKKIIKLIEEIEEEKYLKYIYILVKELLDNKI